jgi:hypothetical protein
MSMKLGTRYPVPKMSRVPSGQGSRTVALKNYYRVLEISNYFSKCRRDWRTKGTRTYSVRGLGEEGQSLGLLSFRQVQKFYLFVIIFPSVPRTELRSMIRTYPDYRIIRSISQKLDLDPEIDKSVMNIFQGVHYFESGLFIESGSKSRFFLNQDHSVSETLMVPVREFQALFLTRIRLDPYWFGTFESRSRN